MQKILYILRHAKAEAGSSGGDDRDRRLTSRGMQEAERMGQYLTAQNIRPGLVLCSTAVRCCQTAKAVLQEMPDVTCRMADKLYLASANELLALLAEIPETVPAAMVIGHNPGLHELCLKLAGDGDNALRFKLSLKFPTCALATLAFNGPWREIAQARATLAGFVTPKVI